MLTLIPSWVLIYFVTIALDKLHFQEWGCMKENQWPVVSLFSTYPVYICSQFY